MADTFYKYYKEKNHAIDLIEHGKIKIGTLYEYKTIEDRNRRDIYEGTALSYLKVGGDGISIKTSEDLKGPLERMFKIPPEGTNAIFYNATFAEDQQLENVYTFSVSNLLNQNLKLHWGEYVVKIHDMYFFNNIVGRKLVLEKLSDGYGAFYPCTYTGRSGPYDQGNLAFFRKDHSYYGKTRVDLLSHQYYLTLIFVLCSLFALS